MYNLQKLCTAFLCSFTMCFRVVYKIKQRTELQFVPFRALLFLFSYRADLPGRIRPSVQP